MKKSARNLQERLVIEQPVYTSDGAGGQLTVWQMLDTVWAELIPASGRTVFAAQQRQERITHTVSIRYRNDVTAAMRMVLGNRYFAIHAVMDQDGKKQWLALLVEEGVQ